MFQDTLVRGDSRADFAGAAIHRPAHNAIKLRDGSRAMLLQLDETFIGQMLELQEREQSGNTIKRTRASLQNLLDSDGDGVAFGIVTRSGRLIAQATLRMNCEIPEILTGKFNAATHAPTTHAIIGCVMVDPDYAGQGLAPRLIEQCLGEARERGAHYAHARILAAGENGRTANPASMHTFREKFSFIPIARGQSPEAEQKRIVDFMVLKLGN